VPPQGKESKERWKSSSDIIYANPRYKGSLMVLLSLLFKESFFRLSRPQQCAGTDTNLTRTDSDGITCTLSGPLGQHLH